MPVGFGATVIVSDTSLQTVKEIAEGNEQNLKKQPVKDADKVLQTGPKRYEDPEDRKMKYFVRLDSGKDYFKALKILQKIDTMGDPDIEGPETVKEMRRNLKGAFITGQLHSTDIGP